MNRQSFITFSLAGLKALVTPGEKAFVSGKIEKSPVVLVHGAWHGGWCWKYVKRILDNERIEVFTPTLTGLGDRHHLDNISTNLDTHIADIVNVIEAEELSNVLLVGHSYAGMVITGVADKLRGRIRKLTYVDAFVPDSGQCVFDLLSDDRREMLIQSADGEQKIPPLSPRFLGVTDSHDSDWLNRRMLSQYISTFSQKLFFKDISTIERIYIHCVNPPSGSFGQFAQRFANDANWKYLELNAGHDCMITAPEDLAAAIIKELK